MVQRKQEKAAYCEIKLHTDLLVANHVHVASFNELYNNDTNSPVTES